MGIPANLFANQIAALANNELEGTSEDVPLPYDEFVLDGIDPPALNGCNASVTINFRFTQAGGNLNPNPDTTGTADVIGMYEPGLTFFQQNDTAIPGIQA